MTATIRRSVLGRRTAEKEIRRADLADRPAAELAAGLLDLAELKLRAGEPPALILRDLEVAGVGRVVACLEQDLQGHGHGADDSGILRYDCSGPHGLHRHQLVHGERPEGDD